MPYQASVSFSIGGLMITVALASAFFSLLANYWTNVERRRSYPYRLRETLRAASLSDANHDLQLLSETDALTGLANRRLLQPHLDRLWSRHQRGEAEGAVVLIDIDHFKGYNHYYGHLLGDECLRMVAATLEGALSPQDVIARFSGEEFVVLLGDVPPEAADRALYRAKRNGRDRLEDAESSTISVQPTPEEVRAALANGQFELHFQPLYQLAPRSLTGYERAGRRPGAG